MLFINKIENPEEFLQKVLTLEDDVFHKNANFSAQLMYEAKSKLKDRTIIDQFLQQLWNISFLKRHSNTVCFRFEQLFENITYTEILKSINLLGGVEFFERQLKQLNINLYDMLFLAYAVVDRTLIPLLVEQHDKYIISEEQGSEDVHFEHSLTLIYISQWVDLDTIPLLKQIYQKTKRRGARELAIENIIKSGGIHGVNLLSEIFEGEADIEIRIIIAEGVGKLGNRENALGLFKRLLVGITDSYRKGIIGINMLGFGDDAAVQIILEAFEELNDVILSESLLHKIEYQLEPGVATSLFEVLREREINSEVKVEIDNLLGGWKDVQFNQAVRQLSGSPEEVEVEAFRNRTKGLLTLVSWDRRHIRFLMKLTKEEERNGIVRCDIYKIIAGMGDESTIPFFEERFKKEEYFGERVVLAEILGNFKGKNIIGSLMEWWEKEKTIIGRCIVAHMIDRWSSAEEAVLLLKKYYNTKCDEYRRKSRRCEEMENMIAKIVTGFSSTGLSNVPRFIYSIVRESNIRVFEDNKGLWNVKETPKRYKFINLVQ